VASRNLSEPVTGRESGSSRAIMQSKRITSLYREPVTVISLSRFEGFDRLCFGSEVSSIRTLEDSWYGIRDHPYRCILA
jgi:hypothetical protein